MSRLFTFMRRTFCSLCVVSLLLVECAAAAPSKKAEQQYISLNIPQVVLADVIQQALPIRIDTDSGALNGEITVVNIDQLLFDDQRISCNIVLAGRNMELATELAGHQIKLKVGNIDLDFFCAGVVRFDVASQTLYIRPTVTDVQSVNGAQQTELGKTILALLNGREFPVTLDQLKPIVAKASNKTVVIDTKLAGIKLSKQGLTLSMLPQVSTR